MKVLLDIEKCIGCGSCENACSEVFKMGEDMKAHVENQEADKDCVKEAADICPVQAIKIEE